MIEVFIGPKKAHPVKTMNTTKTATKSPAAPFLPPVKVRIREIMGLTASEISRMSKNDKRMGASSENVWMKAIKDAPRIM
jgi:hypothetical protein